MNLISSLNLASETPLEKQQNRKIKTILQFLIDHTDSLQFRQPVDYIGLGLTDYTLLISKPMDLGTVNNKFKQDQYRFVEQILDDIQLIWDNCKTYNQSASWIYGIADKMDRFFKKLIKNYFGSVIVCQSLSSKASCILENVSLQSADPNMTSKTSKTAKKIEKNQSKFYYQEEEDLTNSEKARILEKMKKLNPQNLGIIIQIILQNCPKAYKYVDNDFYQIYIERIDNWLLKEIKEKIIELRQDQDKLIKKIKM